MLKIYGIIWLKKLFSYSNQAKSCKTSTMSCNQITLFKTFLLLARDRDVDYYSMRLRNIIRYSHSYSLEFSIYRSTYFLSTYSKIV